MSGTAWLTSEDTVITLNGLPLQGARIRTSEAGDVDILTDPPHSLPPYANEEHRAVRSSTEDRAYTEQALVLSKALYVYEQRNQKYKDNWRRFGWRGCIFRLRERVERLWDHLWDAPPGEPIDVTEFSGEEKHLRTTADQDIDDALDLINFAAFTVRAVREGNRDGSWW